MRLAVPDHTSVQGFPMASHDKAPAAPCPHCAGPMVESDIIQHAWFCPKCHRTVLPPKSQAAAADSEPPRESPRRRERRT